jgi:hypothetical protein
MQQLTQITADALQQQSVVLPDGSQFLLQLYYRPQQYGWFINQLTYNSFQLQGLRVTVNPNMLYQWKNQIPFGLACLTLLTREPTQQQDFSSGNFGIYLLSAAEVDQYTEFLSNGS